MVKKLKEIKYKTPLVLGVQSNSGEIAFIETGNSYRLTATWELINEINALFGEKAIHLKAYKSVPEVRKRHFYPKAKAN